MRWAPNIDALLLSYARTGNVPQALASRPTLTPEIAFFLECFGFLSRHRQSNGYTRNPIPLVDIVAVAGPLGFRTSDEFLFFAEIMSEMDVEYMTYQDERLKMSAATKTKR